MADFNTLLSGAINTVNQSSDAMAAINGLLSANTARLQEISTVNTSEGVQAVEQVKQSTALKASAQFAQDSVKEKAQNILNINPDVAENELQVSTNALNAANAQYTAARGEFDTASQVKLLDNPIGYIFAQLELPQVAAKVNAAVGAQKAAENNINVRLDLAKKYNSTVVANTAGTLQDAAMLQADAEARLGLIKVREAEAANSSRIAGQLMNQAALVDKVSDNKVKIVNMQIAVANAEANREQMALAREQAAALRAERLKKMTDDKASEDEWNIRLQRVEQFVGAAPGMFSLKNLKMFTKDQQEAIRDAAISNSLGDDLTTALRTYSNLPGRGNISATNPGVSVFIDKIGSSLNSYAVKVQADYTKTHPGKAMPAKEVGPEAAQEYQFAIASSASGTKAAESMSSPNWDNTFHPLKAAHKVLADEITAGKIPVLAGNPFAVAIKTVVSTDNSGRDNITSAEEQRAFGVVRDMVANKKLSPRDAGIAISNYYRVATTVLIADRATISGASRVS